jgi:two-component system, NtrC family, response regulator AtoC
MAGGSKDSNGLGATSPLIASPRLLGKTHLLVVWLGDAARTWPLPPSGELTIGRADDADVHVPSAVVSRQHARLVITPTSVMLRDLGSQNGTRVNGERLGADWSLAYGDIISLGDVTAAFIENRGQAAGTTHARPGAEHLTGLVGLVDSAAPVPAPDDGNARVDLGDRTALVADPAMRQVFEQIKLLAPSDLTVLILGETGTGKEVAAAALRHWSKRRAQPFVTINCASLPEAIAESELFGHERGAFSGAAQAKPGLLESAPGGTVFLDEIGDLSSPVQAKLLRVLETRKLTRLGSVHERSIDVRLVAATHRDLNGAIRAGRFRQDLYYRLSAAVVHLPPLRTRPTELPVMARAFLAEACRKLGRAVPALSPGAIERLRAHDWPGNVRELKNLLENLAATVMDPVIGAQHLAARMGPGAGAAVVIPPPPVETEPGAPASFSDPEDVTVANVGEIQPLAEANRAFERKQIENALQATKGNKTQAARLLGVPLRTFMEKVKRHGLS